MSEVIITCPHCSKKHSVERHNARLHGPVFYVWCPFCRRKTKRNLGKFLEEQINTMHGMGRFDKFCAMVSKARALEELLCDDD